MRDVVLMALASAGGVDAQADSMRAISHYQGQPIEAITPVCGAPVSESRNQNGPVYTFTANTDSTAVSTSSTMGFIGNAQVSATTTAPTPVTIHCRVQVFSDTNKRVTGFKGDGANAASSSMFQ